MGARDYSSAAASNLSVGGISIAEGWARASVNNAYRAGMADIADLLLDFGGATSTTGSANAYLLTLDSAPTAYADNLFFLARANHSNSGAATININGIGVKDIEKFVAGSGTPVALTGGELVSGQLYIFVYSTTANAVLLVNPATMHFVGSDMALFPSRTAAEAAYIPTSADMVETLSFADPGDGGGARYKRIATPTYTYLGDFEDAAGGWWQHAPSGPLRAAEYGVVGGASLSGAGVWSGTDVEPMIKDALYQHIYKLRGGPAELPIGNLFLGRGIHLGYGHTSFQGARLRGAHKGYNYQLYPATTLVWNFTDEPLLSIQGARSTIVEDISFSGPGRKYLVDNNHGSTVYVGADDDTLLETWTDPTWPPQTTSRYAPSAVIAIDPRVGPASSPYYYRDVNYPAEMGAVTQYGKGLSSGVTIKNFNVYGGGMVAIVIHPNENSDGNGDFIRVHDSNISYVPVGLSVTQTQARLTLLDSVDFTRVHTAITTRMHGMQNGVFAEARNCHFSGIQIFDFGDTSVAGHITINGYGEGMWRIGDVATTSAVATKLVLHQLRLAFDLQIHPATPVRGVPPTLLGGSGNVMPLEINGGSWTNFKGAAVIDKAIAGVHINGLTLQPFPPTTNQHKCFLNGTAGGLVFPQLGINTPIENIHPKFTPWNLDTGVADFARLVGDRWPSDRTMCTPLWVERHGAQRLRDAGVLIPERVEAAIAGSTFTSPVLSGLTLTTTWAARSDMDYMIKGPLPGDILYHAVSKSVFLCMAANTTTDVVTFQLLNNYRGTTPRNSINFVTDTLCYLASLRWYSPASPIYGIITDDSAIITEAGYVPHGGGGQVGALLSTDIAVDDWLVVDPSLAPYLTQSLCKVTAIDTGAATITLSGNAIDSSTMRVRLGTLVRPGVL